MATSEITHALKVRIGLEMQTSSGLKSMVGPAYVTDEVTNGADLFIQSAAMGLLSYPDQRVTKFRIYACEVQEDAEGEWYTKEYAALKATHSELSYALFGAFVVDKYGISWDTFKVSATIIAAAAIDAIPGSIFDGDPNLVLVSESYQPRMLYARSALPVGNDSEDSVLAFQANAIPVSDGQFGEYPVVAFCRRSIYALRAGTSDIAFTSISPLTVQKGIVGRNAVANIGGQVIYLATDGVYRLGDRDPISFPIQNSESENDLLKAVDSSAALAHFVDKNSGRRELWISTPSRIYCLSLDYKMWYTIDTTRRSFLTAYGELWGIDHLGVVREAGTGTSTPRRGVLITAPIHLNSPEVLKRWRKVIVRYAAQDRVAFTQATDYDITIQLSGVTTLLLSIDILSEPRYMHRVHMRRTNRTIISMADESAAGYASILASLQIKATSLESQLSALSTSTQTRLDALESVGTIQEEMSSGVEKDVPMTGKAVTFGFPWASVDSYLPVVIGFSADRSRSVEVGIVMTTTGMTFYPSEDNAIIYWKAEAL